MRKRRTYLLLAALAAALLGIALLLYFRPLGNIFDRIFGETNDPVPTSVEAEVFERGGDGFARDYPEAQSTVKRFFTLFFTELGAEGASYAGEIEKLYSDGCADIWRDKLALSAVRSLRGAAGQELFYDGFTLSLRYDKVVEVNESMLILTMEVQADLAYRCLDGEKAETPVTSHTLTLKKDGSRWTVSSHEGAGWFWDYASELLARFYRADGYSYSELTYTYLRPYYESAMSFLFSNPPECLSEDADEKPAEYGFDRDSAVQYALLWARGGYLLRNGSFGEYENDSANFISQCLFAGGIPMDCQGDDGSTQWKWYGAEPNLSREPAGCSPSWYDCESFYSYCLSNAGFGLVCSEAALSSAEKGDVMLIYYGGEIAFEAVITGFAADGAPLLTAHSPDLLNVPLSAVCCGGYRLIHISGYNTANI